MHDSIHAMNAQTLQSELNDLREITNCKEGESLRDVVAGLVMDSERYRYLRSCEMQQPRVDCILRVKGNLHGGLIFGEELDSAIDSFLMET